MFKITFKNAKIINICIKKICIKITKVLFQTLAEFL